MQIRLLLSVLSAFTLFDKVGLLAFKTFPSITSADYIYKLAPKVFYCLTQLKSWHAIIGDISNLDIVCSHDNGICLCRLLHILLMYVRTNSVDSIRLLLIWVHTYLYLHYLTKLDLWLLRLENMAF